MIEFKLKVRVDSQDPNYAYNVMRQSLQYTGLDIVIGDSWLKNNRPLPEDVSDLIAANWLATHDPLTIDRRLKHENRWHDAYRKFMETVDALPKFDADGMPIVVAEENKR